MIKKTIHFECCPLNRADKDWTAKIYPSIKEVDKKDWELVADDSNIYLSFPYLEALEQSMKDEMSFSYSISYDGNGKPVLIQYFQIVQFSDKKKEYSSSLIKHLKSHFDDEDGFSKEVLVCGNVFSNGENGIKCSTSINPEQLIRASTKVAKEVSKRNEHGKKVSMVLFKEFWPASSPVTNHFEEHSYQEFQADVNMVLPIHPLWKNMDDYLSSMKTKYRTRAKGVFKKSNNLTMKSLDADAILKEESRIQELFSNVQDKSEYQMGVISAESFAAMKTSLSENFFLVGAYMKDELVGFSTFFINGEKLEANFVGIDYEHNKTHAIYQSLLYDMVRFAIVFKLKEVQLGRTSELVKSAMGAEPVPMFLYGKHQRKITNVLVKAVLKRITPSQYELRQPFKDDFEKTLTLG